MIKKLDSKEFANKLKEIDNNINSIKKNVSNLKNDNLTKLELMKLENEYISTFLINKIKSLNTSIKEKNIDTNNALTKKNINCKNIIDGEYKNICGNIISKLSSKQLNLFNIIINETNEVFFRNDVKINLYDEEGILISNPIDILKHDYLNDKNILINKFSPSNINNDNYKIRLEIVADKNNPLGSTTFNAIEIDPYLKGSFDIDSIILNDDPRYPKNTKEFKNDKEPLIKNVTSGPIILENNSNELLNITFNITLNYKTINNIFPFIINHIYFYNLNLLDNSYIICKLESDKYISFIKNDITINKNNKIYQTTLTDENIKVYAMYENKKLLKEIYPTSNTDFNFISANIKNLYLKIPIEKYDVFNNLICKIESK